MSGQDIRVLQDFLRRAGQQVTIDGEFGTSTWRAVRAFEAANALPVDGVVDAGDIDVLRGQADAGTNPVTAEAPLALAPGDQAQLGPDGLAIAPANAPEPVKQIIAAGNRIAKMPYIYGGGTASGRTGATTARARSPTRCTAAGCSSSPCRPAGSRTGAPRAPASG
jgi:peptidoglycan hydrolase-like protein with peptidoglycan-binding domain